MRFSQKQKRILVCTVYNLLLEYWVHGVIEFINPILFISLFFLYLFYFSMVEDLIVRYHLGDQHVLLIGFIYGMFQETFNTGSVFNNPFFLGINVINVFLANVFWWGILQSVFTIYFTNTVIPEVEEEKKPGALGWTLAIGFNLLLFLGLILEGNLPQASVLGYVICLIIMGIATILLFVIKKPQNKVVVKRIKFIDIVIRVQFIMCIIMGTIINPVFGPVAQYLFILWSVITGGIYLGYILKGKRLVGQIQPHAG